MKTAILILIGSAAVHTAGAQPKGASVKQASPELLVQMKAQAATGLTTSEMAEFGKLHNADTALLHRIIDGDAQLLVKLRTLEDFVNSMEGATNTRLLTEAVKDVATLKQESETARLAKETADADQVAREKTRDDRIFTIMMAVLVGLLGAITSGVIAWLKFTRWDPDRRSAAQFAFAEAAQKRNVALIEHVDATKKELTAVVHQTREAENFERYNATKAT